MDAEQAIVRLLLTDANVAAIIDSRIYPGGIIPQGVEYPALAYAVEGLASVVSLTGVDGARTKRFRIWSATEGIGSYGEAKGLDMAVRARLEGFPFSDSPQPGSSGVVSDGQSPESTLEIQGVFSLSTFDLFETETETHMIVSDFAVSV